MPTSALADCRSLVTAVVDAAGRVPDTLAAALVAEMNAGPMNMWATIQRGLDELLVSPAVKRRAGIGLRRKGVDSNVVAAGEMVGRYKRNLKSV
jgi:hypothetical protein